MKNFKANKKTQINKIQAGNESSEGIYDKILVILLDIL